MIELAKHIEVLLLENDCVIVPGLGGFIAHYRSSIYNKEMREFYPPVRTIGFNPKLVMNDGLLVQSYMSKTGFQHFIKYKKGKRRTVAPTICQQDKPHILALDT